MREPGERFEWVAPGPDPAPRPRPFATRVLLLRAEWETRRAASARRRQLEREIACYATPAERRELLAVLDRHPDAATREIRDILDRQQRRERLGRWPTGAGWPGGPPGWSPPGA